MLHGIALLSHQKIATTERTFKRKKKEIRDVIFAWLLPEGMQNLFKPSCIYRAFSGKFIPNKGEQMKTEEIKQNSLIQKSVFYTDDNGTLWICMGTGFTVNAAQKEDTNHLKIYDGQSVKASHIQFKAENSLSRH